MKILAFKKILLINLFSCKIHIDNKQKQGEKMNKKLLSLTLLTLMATTSYKADAMFYAGGSATLSISDITGVKTKNKMGYTFAAGINFPVPIVSVRAEAEFLSLNTAKLDLNLSGASIDQIDNNIKGNMINAYVGVPLIPMLPIKLYAGYGIGKSELTKNITPAATATLPAGVDKTQKSKNDLAQQYMVGLDVSIPLVPVAGGVEYRFMNKDFTMANDVKENIRLHSVLAKVRYEF